MFKLPIINDNIGLDLYGALAAQEASSAQLEIKTNLQSAFKLAVSSFQKNKSFILLKLKLKKKFFFKIYNSFFSYNSGIAITGSFVDGLFWAADTRITTKATK